MSEKHFKVSTLSNFYIAFMLDGLHRLSGLFMLQILQSMSESRQNATLPFTLSLAVANIIGSLSDFLLKNKHSEYFKLLGVMLTAIGAALCFFTTNVFAMTASWGLIFGSGYGLTMPHLSRHLKSVNSTKLSSFLNASPSLGAAVMPFILHILNSYYGLQGSYLLFSGIILNYLPLSVAAAYNLELRIPNIKWRVRKRSTQYYVEQDFSNEPKTASVESFINSLEPDLILKISQNEECEDEMKNENESYDISVEEMAPLGRKRSDTKGNDLKGLPVDTRKLPKNKTHSEILEEIQNYEKGRKIFEGSFMCNEVIFEEEENTESGKIYLQNSDAQNTNIILTDNILEIKKVSDAVIINIDECTDSNLQTEKSSAAEVLNVEREVFEKCTDDNLQISKVSDVVISNVEREFFNKCPDGNLQAEKSSDAVVLNVEKEVAEKCTDDNLQISKVSDVVISNVERESSDKCPDGNLQTEKFCNVEVLNVEKKFFQKCTDHNLRITQKYDKNIADVELKTNILSAEIDIMTRETTNQNLKNKISYDNADDQSQHHITGKGHTFIMDKILQNEDLTTKASATSELTTNMKCEESISNKYTENKTTVTAMEDGGTKSLQKAEENVDNSEVSDKSDADKIERTLQYIDQNSHIKSSNNTDLERGNEKETFSTGKHINECPPLSPNLNNLSNIRKEGIQNSPPKPSEHKIKVDIPLDIKVHVIECTFSSNEDYWFENSNDKRLNSQKNGYRKHSNSLMPGTYDNIDFNSRNWKKNFAKCSELGKPKLSSIYSISENTDLDTSECPLNSMQKEQSRINYTLSKIKPILRFLGEISTPVCLCIILIAIIFEYNLVVLITIFADFGNDVDNSCSDFKWILVAFGVGGLAGTFCCCKISKTVPEKSHATGVVLFLLTGLSTAGMLFSPNLNWLAGFYCILGALEGGISYTIPKFISEYINQDTHSKLSSLKSFICGLAFISIPYVIGLSRDELGDYEFLLQTLSCSSVLCAFLVYFLPHLSRTSSNRKINI